MSKLAGKVAVVTGGNSGIGLATANLFRSAGAKVAISGRDPRTLHEAARVIGGETIAVRCDVSKTADIEELFATVAQKWGKIDVLFANAGIGTFSFSEPTLTKSSPSMFEGCFLPSRRPSPHLRDRASIVLNASVAGEIGLPGATVYSASKAAVRSLARTLTAELADRGIRVNVVSPGPVPTRILHRNGLSQDTVDKIVRGLVSYVPMKRAGGPGEVANAVLFLASDDSSYVAGVDLNVDGGMGQV